MATISNDFREIVTTREITTKIEKTFLVFSCPWPCGACLLNEPNAAASPAPSSMRHWTWSKFSFAGHVAAHYRQSNLKCCHRIYTTALPLQPPPVFVIFHHRVLRPFSSTVFTQTHMPAELPHLDHYIDRKLKFAYLTTVSV